MLTLPSNIVQVSDGLMVAIVDDSEPWAQYDKPCEACGGSAHTCGCDGTWPTNPNHNRHCLLKRPCTECESGRRMWTVRWPCDNCAGIGGYHGDKSARATIQVVPVTDVWPKGADHTQPVTCVTRNGVLYIEGLDPLPTPGRDFAVIVRLESA